MRALAQDRCASLAEGVVATYNGASVKHGTYEKNRKRKRMNRMASPLHFPVARPQQATFHQTPQGAPDPSKPHIVPV